ncbi:MAG: DUF5655 domain-containing protein [Treponemataceae bacterium]
MVDIKLFDIKNGVTEFQHFSVALEKELQILIEQNMPTFFGVTFLESEYQITNGRIDSLGIDENNCPVIFEYKRSVNENVINQGLFYLDWLLDHKGDFEMLALKHLGQEAAEKIDWSIPCVMCIANDFTKYDEHAVNQMQRNIKLVRYKKFGKDLILFEYLNAPKVKSLIDTTLSSTQRDSKQGSDKTFLEQYSLAPEKLQKIYQTIRDFILSFGDDITENQLKLYVAFKKVKNFICAEIYSRKILLHVKVDPATVNLEPDFIRDVTSIGHFGTGNLQIIIKNETDFEQSKDVILRAYNEN